MKWKELKGKYLVGIMELKQSDTDDKLLFLIRNQQGEPESFIADCRNEDYHWFDNWRIRKDELKEEMNDTYKSIGGTVKSVRTEGTKEEDGRIVADMDKWTAKVGKGGWGPTDGKPYFFIKIKAGLKIIRLGTEYCDCHYPDTIWDLI